MSRTLKYFLISVIIPLFSTCERDGTQPPLLTGDLKVSEILTKTDYQAPIVLENDIGGSITINGETIEFTQGIYELKDAGFYEMEINNSESILFVLLDVDRGSTEWALKKWIPVAPEFKSIYYGDIEIIHPKKYWPSISIPFVFKTIDWSVEESINLSCLNNDGNEFLIKNGIGSTSSQFSDNEALFKLANQNYSRTLEKFDSIDIVISDNIDTDVTINSNSLVHITSDLNINESGSLTIKDGCVLMIDEGINIFNFGSIHFAGIETNPILVSCSESGKYFGGFISEGSQATINAENSFFTNFSFHSSAEYQYGHANHQALFKSKNTSLTFDKCYFLDTPGQVFYPENCNLDIQNCIVQRAKTSGQINSSTLLIQNSYFSDFPDDSQNYRDEDNDGLYLSATNAQIENTMFLYCKDDGIDSGGGEGGIVTVDNCKIEACFHEGMALSSSTPAVKLHTIKNSFISNCQQGVELGFSSPDHTVFIDSCQINNNYVGVRYGDNYVWGIHGKMTVSNSDIIDNTRNIWNMVHQIWAPKDENLTIINSK